MKNTLKYTSSVLVLVLLSATVYGGSSTPAGAPKKRTWAEWASQKAAANNVFASRDARAAAAAQLKLGTAEMQETKAAADLKYQQDRTAQQARDVQAAAAAQARLAELNKSIALQKEAARLERQNRSNIRLGIPSAAPAQAAEPIAAPVTAKSAAPAPAQPAEPIAAAVTAKSAAPTAAPAPAHGQHRLVVGGHRAVAHVPGVEPRGPVRLVGDGVAAGQCVALRPSFPSRRAAARGCGGGARRRRRQ